MLPGTFIWLTAFDQPRPAPARKTQHANSVLGVVGLLFDVRPERLDDLSHLAGQSMAEGALRIGDVSIAATGADGPPRQFPLRAVVLRADSLEAFDRVLGRIRQVEGIASTETSLLLSTHKL